MSQYIDFHDAARLLPPRLSAPVRIVEVEDALARFAAPPVGPMHDRAYRDSRWVLAPRRSAWAGLRAWMTSRPEW